MMVESHKLERIAFTILEQAGLLRSAGRIPEADGMERRALELRLLASRPASNPVPMYQAA